MLRIAALLLFVLASPSISMAGDWPTYLHDNSRSARTDENLTPPLSLRWIFEAAAKPDPAWTRPAKEAARVRFDDCLAVISVGERVYFGSSGDNKVYALDNDSGRVVWEFFAGGRTVHRAQMQSELTIDSVLARARALSGKAWKPGWNCEHFVCEALGLAPESPQLRGVVTATSLVLAVGLLSRRK